MNDNPTMQDVLGRFYPNYLDSYTPTGHQAKTVYHILNCKTGAYGANISKCDTCGHSQYHNNSCRDRSCPMCQALANELWVDAQNEHVLDIDYYHLVFTCPSELNTLIYCSQKELYPLFFMLWQKPFRNFQRIHYTWEVRRDLSASCIRGDPIFLTILISMRYQPVAGRIQIVTGIRKRMVFSCREKQWPGFLRKNFCLG